jgi:hypothetical protein
MQHRAHSTESLLFPPELRAALERVALVESEDGFHSAYDILLSELGNNHAGTHSARAIAALPELSLLLASGSPWVRRTVIEALIDLCGSFEPEPGLDHAVEDGFLIGARLLAPQVRAIAAAEGPAANAAEELLRVLGADV